MTRIRAGSSSRISRRGRSTRSSTCGWRCSTSGPAPARVLLRFLQPGGATLPALRAAADRAQRRTLTARDLAGLTSPDFSTVVESDQPIVVDRTMSWDASGYGSHAETARRLARDDVVSRRRIDLGRLRAVLPAAEPEPERRRPRPCATCGRSGSRRSSGRITLAADLAHDDCRRRSGAGARVDRRVRGHHRRRSRSSSSGRCT